MEPLPPARSVREITHAPALWLASLVLLVMSGCGRLNLELLPFDVAGENDGGTSQDAAADGGIVDVCVAGVCASRVLRCPPSSPKGAPAICGCETLDVDSDGDDTPDCNDLCPGVRDQLTSGEPGCAAAAGDSDLDGTPNHLDRCPRDPGKRAPGLCGCGISDVDGDTDGMPDCADACASDRAKVVAGQCGCGVEERTSDFDRDGTIDCRDRCNGIDDARYVSEACGVGYCRATSSPSSCVAGVETACRPGTPRAASDSSCDGVDDDCDGSVDEEFVATASSCGVGACRASGMLSCVGGQLRDSCTAGAAAATDGPTKNGIDDDCDGAVDEEACSGSTLSFGPGRHAGLSVPQHCGRARVQLWGGGGGAGDQTEVGSTGSPGRGGAGGFAQQDVLLSGALELFVGNGGSGGCANGSGGTNAGAASYNGGAGGQTSADGSPGGDGMVSGGGAGATSASAGQGGRGHFGGGGGGSGRLAPWPPYPGTGGGGGAASVLLVGGSRVVVAGGGGGGGGASGSSLSSVGGVGGEGCSGPGGSANAGGGGGGGLCVGSTTARGTNGVPANLSLVAPGRAAGGTGTCGAGGGGHAIVTFLP